MFWWWERRNLTIGAIPQGMFSTKRRVRGNWPMKQVEQARLFMGKAAEDESLLDAVLSLPGVSDAIFGFHCQQAAEKLLKAILSYHGIAFSRTHDLQELMELLETAGHPLPDDAATADELTPFAVQFRYDDLSRS